jgi:hypothetical protein
MLLACGSLALLAQARGDDATHLAWSPSREEAIILGDAAGGTIVGEPALSPSLMMRRPRSLSRPVPGQSYFTQTPAGSESLPAVTGTPVSPDALSVPPEMYYDDATGGLEGPGAMGADYYGAAGACATCGPGSNGCWRGWGACGWLPICVFIPLPPPDALELFGGVQGFTGPANRGGSGSFGFHEGFNWGLPVFRMVSAQFGANWTQSNFDGNYLTTDTRNQIFVTGGAFRRVDWGLQGGLVVDYQHDAWDYRADLAQLRGELSWVFGGCNDAGFWFTVGINNASNVPMRLPVIDNAGTSVRFIDSTASLNVNNINAFFFRRRFAGGGQGRLFTGFTSHSQWLVGADAQLPINAKWSVRSNFLYATPGSSNAAAIPDFARESWNVSLSLVWTPFAKPACGPGYDRPLFNVANNGSFLTRLVP